MSTYLKLFETHTQYETFIGGGGNTPFVKPNVSYCTEENEVHYNPIPDYSKDYLTFVALEDGTISFDILNSIGTDKITSISYSTDNGANWTTTENRNDKQENLSITVNVNKGDKILWKGDAKTLGFYVNDEVGFVGSFFSSTAKFDAAGNVMSLIYGDEYKNKITIEKEYTFCFLFCGYNLKKTCGIVNAKNLSLPATTLASGCYSGMFFGCTNLVNAPTLPATTLTEGCYNSMFNGCTGLTTAPELPATTLANSCYGGMFYGCTKLVNAPTLPATTLANYCYQNMFYDCTSLTTAPTLPATTLTSSCYNSMFNGCTGLTTAPELPATTLTNSCYGGMFSGCTGLTTAPELPATTLAIYCYSQMFKGCTSLTTAPELPATTLAYSCYQNMFDGCSSLNYIKCLATTISATSCLSDWVSGVASIGTFVKAANMTSWTTGTSGIPSGWTIETATV